MKRPSKSAKQPNATFRRRDAELWGLGQQLGLREPRKTFNFNLALSAFALVVGVFLLLVVRPRVRRGDRCPGNGRRRRRNCLLSVATSLQSRKSLFRADTQKYLNSACAFSDSNDYSSTKRKTIQSKRTFIGYK